MGIVQRQGLRNTVISYAGLGIGFVNTTLVLPRLLLPAQLGLLSVLVALATLGSKLAEFGFTNMALRYFPYYRDPAARHRGFLPLLLGVPLAVFSVVVLGMWLGRPWVLAWYAQGQDAAAVARHYGAMLLLAFCILLYNLLDAYAKSLFLTAFSSFLTEVVQRVLIVSAALLYATHVLSFDGFVLAYLGAYAAVAAALLGYLAVAGELHLRPTRAVLAVRPLGELLRFSSFVLLGNISGNILVTVDALMLGSQKGLADAGIYAIALNISTALAIPFRALNKTAYPLVAEYWKEGATGKLLDFYRRSTLLATAGGAYLALGIGLNLPFIYGLIHRPEFAAGSVAVLLLLAGRLTDGVTSLNGIIVATSPRYRYDLIFNVSLAATIVLLNWLLIPRLGLTGAALSNALALVGINLIRTWFVWRSFGWQPFDRRVLYLLLLAAAAGTAAGALPGLGNIWLTLLLRGGVLTVLYGAGLLLGGWVPEVNKVARRLGWPAGR